MNTEITKKDVTEYISKAVTGLSEGTAADGGNLITRYIADQIINKAFYESIVAKNCKQYTYTGGGDGLKIPYCTSPLQNEPTTGIRAYWIAEAAQKTISKPQIGQADVGFSKLVVRVPVTDELRADSSLVYDLVLQQGAGAMAYKIDYEILRGKGLTSTILGVASGAGTIGTTFVGVASAGAVVNTTTLGTFVSALHPQAYKDAQWYVSPDAYRQIAQLDEQVISWGAEGNKLHAYGFPVVVAPQLDNYSTYVAPTTAAGSGHEMPNHMILADFSNYCLVQRPPQVKESSDFRFQYDESEIRIVLRIGGQMAAETMTLDDGRTYGYAVVPQYVL
jgi:HK97 family phage major capsid protein